jgi:phytoene dehydrogenase-like protein
MSGQHVIVVGGGLAGLTAACELARQEVAVTVFEGSARLGGRARSTVRDGTIRNFGPHALHTRGPGTAILEGLGIELPGRRPASHQTRLLFDGRIVSPLDRRLGGVTRALAALARRHRAGRSVDPAGSVSVADWLEDRVPDPATRRLFAPLVRLATYADADEQQAADMLTEALRAGGVRYLDGGWDALVQRLRKAASAAGATITAGAPVVSIRRGRSWIVTTRDRVRHAATDVILAAGGPAAAANLVEHASAADTLQRWADRAVPGRMACLDVALTWRPPGPSLVLGVDDPLYLSVQSDRSRIASEGGAVVQVARFLPLGGRAPDGTRDELESLLDRVLEGWRDVLVHARYLPNLTVTHDGAPTTAGGRRARPGPEVPGVDGLYVAGDWVGTRGTLAQTSIVSGAIAAGLIAPRATRCDSVPLAGIGRS